MTKLNTLFAAIALAAILGAPLMAQAADSYEVDPVHSSVVFNIKHLDVSYVFGRFDTFSGTIDWDAENPANSSVALEVQIDSVNTGNSDRDDHLRSPDFFNAAEYAVATFTSTGVELLDDNRALVTGDFTLMGVTRELEVEVWLTGQGTHPKAGDERIGFETGFTINRSDFGMDFMLPMLSDRVEIIITLQGAH
jgi:polyisoprenoid-binding protein YceI